MYPEAGGSARASRAARSTSSGRSSPPGRRCSPTSATIAISAFFVPHYLGGLFWDALRHSPGRHHLRRCIMIAVLGAINIVGVKESTGVNVLLAVVDFLTQVLLVLVGAFLVLLAADRWSTTCTRRRADVDELRPRDPDRHARLHGHRDVSNMSEEAKDEAHDDPGGDRPRARSPCSRSTSRCPPSRSSALPVTQCADGEYHDAARPARGAGRLRRRPGRSAWSRRWTSAPCSSRRRSTSACWPRRSCSWPPTRA